MVTKKECVAMLLAGGQGSRLFALTNKIAKPAVSFGGKYRIIDFPLSNCVNSGIDTVGVLTQYQPLILNEYIGNGEPWDLDWSFGGVHILSPYQAKHGSEWYKGTANAIYQNISFIKRYDPDYVLILSGDHIYKMDYSEMLEHHKDTHADCTIAAINVPLSEASRFGVLNVDKDGVIYQFEEKPAKPKSTLASMGIYIFTAEKLYKYLEQDENNPDSSKDFGKNVLPAMLENGERMVSYRFDGYWKDVGTINSLFESNMDLLGDSPNFDIADTTWRIRSRNPIAPPHYIGEDGRVVNSIVASGCEIEGIVENSVLSHDVTVCKGAVIKNSIIFSNTVIGEDAKIEGIVENSVLSHDVTVCKGAVIKNSIIFSNTVIGEDAKIDYSIVDENVNIGKDAIIGGADQTETDPDNLKIAVLGRDIKVSDGAKIESGKIIDTDI